MTMPKQTESPLAILGRLLTGAAEQLDRVAQVDAIITAFGERLDALERRLALPATPEERVDASIDLGLGPDSIPDKRHPRVRVDEIDPPTEEERASYKPTPFDPSGVEDLERRAEEALTGKVKGSDGFDGIVRHPDGVSRLTRSGTGDSA